MCLCYVVLFSLCLWYSFWVYGIVHYLCSCVLDCYRCYFWVYGIVSGSMFVSIGLISTFYLYRFNVNIVHGNGFHGNADTAMHCDVRQVDMWRESHHRCWLDAKPVTGYMISFRFHYGDSHNIVVRTHRQHGSWGSEERHAPFFPFQPGQPFEMIVRCEHDKYMVSNSAFGQFMKGLTTPNFLLLQSCVLSVDCCQQPAHVRIPAPRSSYPPI